MTTAAGTQIVPRPPAALPALRAADQGVPTPWRPSSPTAPGASTAPSGSFSTSGAMRWDCVPCRRSPSPWPATWPPALAPASASPPCAWSPPPSPRLTNGPATNRPAGTKGVRASLKGWGRRLSKPQRQAGALTADVLAVIRLTAVQPRLRGRGVETPQQVAERARFDLALVAALSDAGLRRSEAASLTWGDVQRWDDGSGRITVVRSKTDVEAAGAVVAITPAAMQALDVIRPADAGGEVKVFGLSESQIARRVKAIARAAGLADWEFYSGHTVGGWAWRGAWPRTAPPPTRSNARAAGNRVAAWSAATPAASPPDRRCGTFNRIRSVAQAPAPNSKAGWAIAARTRESRSSKLPAVIFQVYSRARRGIGTWDDAARIGLWRLHPYGTWDFTLQPTAFRIVPGSKHVQTPWSTSP